jgi:DNA-binding transcriptional MerR regulator
MIQHALDAGFTLADLARILKQRDAGGVPCREVLAIASARLAELDQRVAMLTNLRDRLEKALGEWRRQLDATPPGKRARLLESLSAHLSQPAGIGHRRLNASSTPTRTGIAFPK